MRWTPAFGLASVLALGSCGNEAQEAGGPVDLYTVARGELRIVVREQAELQAAQNTRVASAVEGRSTLIYLIPEGTMVEPGTKLAELEVSRIAERRATRAIEVTRAEAARQMARKNFDIVETTLVVAKEAAQGKLALARIRHEKFVSRAVAEQSRAPVGTNAEMVESLRELVEEPGDEASVANAGLVDGLIEILGGEETLGRELGEIANLVLRQIDQVKLVRASAEHAADKSAISEILLETGAITTSEAERDRLAWQSAQSKLDLAWNALALLINFTLEEKLVTLVQDVAQAQLELSTVLAQNDASRLEVQVEMASTEAEYLLALERVEHWDAQMENAIIRAPTSGIVVYARQGRRGREESVREGMEVRQGQALINLPDVTSMIAELGLPEAQVELVTVGQEAVVRVGYDSSRAFTGRVTRVGALPVSGTPGSANMYPAVVTLDGGNSDLSLRPGMNAEVEILAGIVPNTLTVPLAAVHSERGRNYVWIATDEGPLAALVGLGANNATHVEVTTGLREGDRIYLAKPPGDPVPTFQIR